MCAGGGHAQVYKCQGADGKTIYSQAPCPDAGRQMRPGELNGTAFGGKSVASPRDRAILAPPPAAPAAPPPPVAAVPRPAAPVAAPRKKADAEDEDDAVDTGPGVPRGPSRMAKCDGDGCWGTDGQRYNRTQEGNFFRSDGKFCTKSYDGRTVNCPN